VIIVWLSVLQHFWFGGSFGFVLNRPVLLVLGGVAASGGGVIFYLGKRTRVAKTPFSWQKK
jgi:hypothetical protein